MPSAPWPRLGTYKFGDYVWFVPSRGTPGAFRKVELHKASVKEGWTWTCTCPAGEQRGKMGTGGRWSPRCRHCMVVEQAEQADGLPERPRAKLGEDLSRFYE